MKTYYLIYVYRGEIKVRHCKRSVQGHSFEPIPKAKHYYYTQIPESPMILQYGKIYCETLGGVPECVRIIKEHYKDRVLQLERSIELGRLIIGEDL